MVWLAWLVLSMVNARSDSASTVESQSVFIADSFRLTFNFLLRSLVLHVKILKCLRVVGDGPREVKDCINK